MIRQVSLRQRLPGAGAVQEIDQVWAALQRSSLTTSQHGQAVSVSELVSNLCVATGVLLVYRDTGADSADVVNLLTGLKGCVLREAALLSTTIDDHHIHSCCGVVCSLLMAHSGIASLPHALHGCIAAAVGEVFLQQALAAAPQTPKAQAAPFATALVLIYATSIFAAFSSCVLTARTPKELQALLEPLAVPAASACLPEAYTYQQELSAEQRAVLQRSMVPVLHQIMQRTMQLAAAAAPPQEPAQPISGHKYLRLQQFPVLQHICKLLASEAQAYTTTRPPTQPDAASTAVAVTCAYILSMAYHAPSCSASPHLSSLVSNILAQLVQSRTSALHLAQHIIRPPCLRTAYARGTHPVTSLHMAARCANGIARHAANAQGATAEHQARLQERAELHQGLNEHVMPALQRAGYWPSAACFVLTLLMPCLPHTRLVNPGHSETAFWEGLLKELLPVLQALAISQDTVSTALEVCMTLAQACPDDVPSKAWFCRHLTGLMCLHLPESDPDRFASALAGVAKHCQPAVATRCCELCCSMTRVGAPAEVQLQVVRALISVVVHGHIGCLHPVLQLVSLHLRSFKSDSDKERALAHVRHGLMHCHDFRKKPDCVRWFHEQLSSLQPSSL